MYHQWAIWLLKNPLADPLFKNCPAFLWQRVGHLWVVGFGCTGRIWWHNKGYFDWIKYILYTYLLGKNENFVLVAVCGALHITDSRLFLHFLFLSIAVLYLLLLPPSFSNWSYTWHPQFLHCLNISFYQSKVCWPLPFRLPMNSNPFTLQSFQTINTNLSPKHFEVARSSGVSQLDVNDLSTALNFAELQQTYSQSTSHDDLLFFTVLLIGFHALCLREVVLHHSWKHQGANHWGEVSFILDSINPISRDQHAEIF